MINTVTPPWEPAPVPGMIILDLLPLRVENGVWFIGGKTYRIDEFITDQFNTIDFISRALADRSHPESCTQLIRDLIDNAEDEAEDEETTLWVPNDDAEVYISLYERILYRLANLLHEQFIRYGMYDANGWLMYDLTDLAGPWSPVFTYKFSTVGYLPTKAQIGLNRL